MMKRKKLFTLAVLLLLICTVLALSGCSTVPKGQNLLSNNDFAKGSTANADGWFFESYLAVTDGYGFANEGPNGEKVFKMTVTEGNDARLVQKVAVKPNTNYRLTVLCKTQDVAQTGFGANISVKGMFDRPDALSGTNDWTTLTFYGKTAATQRSTEVYLRLGFYSGDNTGTVWFTNAQMVEVSASEIPQGTTVLNLEDRLQSSAEPEESDEDSERETGIYVYSVLFAAFFIGAYFVMRRMPVISDKKRAIVLVALCAIGVIIRIIQSSSYYGFGVDIGCFSAWGSHMLSVGPFEFYGNGYFCDYPPLYMIILALPAWLASVFGVSLTSESGLILLKLPAVACDIATAVLLYRVADKKMPKMSLVLAAAYLFNPAVIVDSASWGQVDSVFCVFIFLAIYYVIKNKMWKGVIFYYIALLLKPQALMFAPIMLVGAIRFSVNALKGKLDDDKQKSKKQFYYFIYSMAGAVISFLLLGLAMQADQDVTWLFGKYFGTMVSYKYATLSAANFMGLIGGQWANDTALAFDVIPYSTLGIILMAVVFALTAWLYYKKHKNRSLFLIAAVLIAGLFTFAPYMHERYNYPVLGLLLFAYIVYADRRLLYLFAGYTVTNYINIAQVLYLHFEPNNANGHAYFAADDTLFLLLSLANVLLFIYLVYVTVTIQYGKSKQDKLALGTAEDDRRYAVQTPDSEEKLDCEEILAVCKAPKTKTRLLSKKDWLIMLGVTLVYSVVTLCNLGSLSSPESYWEASKDEQLVLDFGTVTHVQRAYVNNSINNGATSFNSESYNGAFTLEYSVDGENWEKMQFEYGKTNKVRTDTYRYTNAEMYHWRNLKEKGMKEFDARYVRITAKQKGMRLNEMTFFSSADATEPIAIVDVKSGQGEHGAYCLVDEQDTAAAKPTYYNGMIFDEIYHARTAYEMINGWQIYEWTHPPLGKAIMSLGIRIFGMNPFGWRFMGNLMGILMLPAMYCFGKLLFKKTKWATALMLLMTFDGMHFVQTRLATVDSYAVFFIILMYLFMFWYCKKDWYRDGLLKSFIPLGLSGIAFGLGVACKWIGAYAGAGLAVIFFANIIRRAIEAKKLARAAERGKLLAQDAEIAKKVSGTVVRNIIATLLFCIIFFVVIPATIYCASYGSYFDAPGNKGAWYDTVLQNQTAMFNYHKGITNDDNYWQSEWYTWPICWHNYWYYSAHELTDGAMGTIACMGNPIVWWAGFASTIAALVLLVRRYLLKKRTTDKPLRAFLSEEIRMLLFLFVGIGANFCPWMLVTRSTFIYHYFASTVFIMIFTVYIMRQLCASYAHKTVKLPVIKRTVTLPGLLCVAFLAVCFIVACMFYPIWSGIETTKSYVGTFLWWLPGFNANGHGQGWHFYN